jgi:hypothetical protein
LRAAAEQASPALRALEEQAQAAAPGRAYLLERKRDEALAGEIRSFLNDSLTAILEPFEAGSSGVRLDEVPANQDESVELVLKGAFLVDEQRADAFQANAAAIIERSAARGLTIEVSGPWAPYSFTDGAA